MFIPRDLKIQDMYLKLSVRNYIYHSLNEEVIKNCNMSLPIPYLYYIEFLIDKNSLHKWVKINKRVNNGQR